MRSKRQQDGLNLSFLDVVSCGFGAVILLLVVTKAYEPTLIDGDRKQMDESIAVLERELAELHGEASVLRRDLEPLRDQTSEGVERVRLARGELEQAEDRYFTARESMAANRLEEGELRAARQDLTQEMERLLAGYKAQPAKTTVVGLPVDTEYLVFVIDTSSSMVLNAWPTVQRLVDETLSVYPTVKGLQVLDDEGRYLFPSYARQWIPDSPELRRMIIQRIRGWRALSDSDPTEGIAEAISSFYDGKKKVSIHVFGDDFRAYSAEAVVRYVERINKPDQSGNRPVRIHGVGFPVHLTGGAFKQASHFANLMRVLCERNGGTFVALATLD